MSENAEIITGTGTTEKSDKALFDPETPHEKAIAKYLTDNASEALIEKIRAAKSAGFDIHTCMNYITGEARKLATNNCAMVEDSVVYGWAVHYFEDEWESEVKKKAADEAKRAEAKAKSEAERIAKEKAEAERIAALTPEERELEERARAEEEAAKAFAADEAKRELEEKKAKEKAERRAQQRILKKLEAEAYEAAKAGLAMPDEASYTKEQKAAVKTGYTKYKAELAAAKKAEREAKAERKAQYEAAQGDLFADLFN